ncbi:34764_t:CDS:2, partial [Racocetra persica]
EVNNDIANRKAQSKVDKEVKDQLPKEVNGTTRWKQTERAKKYMNFSLKS